MTRSVLVLGAGVAALSAAWAARREGKAVTVVGRAVGATALAGGAVDDLPWEHRVPGAAVTALDDDVVAFAEDLRLWTLPRAGAPCACLAAAAGRLRPARGHDRALLDLASAPGAEVILPRAPRPGWDADALAGLLRDDPLAASLGLGVRVVDVPVLLRDDERRIADGDLAARHDDEARVAWLADRLRDATAGVGARRPVAVLLGPWLGAAAPRAAEVSERAGVRVGEVLRGVGSPAGLRFLSARDGMLERLGVEVVRAEVSAISRKNGRVRVQLEQATLTADAVVIAVGGVAAGGVIYDPPEHAAGRDLPPHGGVPFRLSLEAPVTLGVRGEALGVVSSLHGPDLDATAWPDARGAGVLEAVGVRCEGTLAAPDLHAAGDVIADRPRTMIEAVRSGIRAGRAA